MDAHILDFVNLKDVQHSIDHRPLPPIQTQTLRRIQTLIQMIRRPTLHLIPGLRDPENATANDACQLDGIIVALAQGPLRLMDLMFREAGILDCALKLAF